MPDKKVPNVVLDAYLKELCHTIRDTGSLLMAIEFRHGSKTYRVDTMAEAVALSTQLGQREAAYGDGTRKSSWTADLAFDTLDKVGELQKKFLCELALYACEIQGDKLVDKLGLESAIALAGLISGLSRQLKKLAINPEDVYTVRVQWNGKTKDRFFILNPDFRSVVTALGLAGGLGESRKEGRN
jgi:hypothetical protein